MAGNIYCGSCHDGPFEREHIVDSIKNGSYDENIQGSFWFCEWCRRYTDPGDHETTLDRLVARARSNGAQPAFPGGHDFDIDDDSDADE